MKTSLIGKETAQNVYDHLAETGQAFCFLDGILIDRNLCAEVLGVSIRELKHSTGLV